MGLENLNQRFSIWDGIFRVILVVSVIEDCIYYFIVLSVVDCCFLRV